MNNPAPAAPPVSELRDPNEAEDQQILRAGLELTRASQLTMLRLGLALHQSKRRAAMEAVDHLLDIDADMAELVARLGNIPGEDKGGLSGFISLQKAAIAAEKHALTGSDAPALAPMTPDDWADSADLPAIAPPADDQWAQEQEERAGGRPWLWILATAILLIAGGLALVAYLRPEALDIAASLFDAGSRQMRDWISSAR